MADPQCRTQYERSGGRQRGDRIVRCHLERGHPGEHEEADTGVTWRAASAGRAAEPRSDQGVGDATSGPGWDRDAVEDIWRGLRIAGDDASSAQIRALLADRDQLAAALTNARAVASDRIADRDRDLRAVMAERDGVRAELARMAGDIEDRDATLAMRTAQLREARRDAAAAALDWAANYWDLRAQWPGVGDLIAWAAEVRDGTRTIPPTDRSSG